MFNRDLKEFLMLGNRFFIDLPASYTTHYNLKKYLDGDDPGADALNEDKDLIDAGIYSASLDNMTATVPVVKTGNNISLQYNSSNLKLTSNELNTAQGINTGSSPTFANLTVVDDVTIGVNSSDTALVFVSGTLLTRGVMGCLGDFGVTGSVWVHANTTLTGSLYVSASLVSRKLVINPAMTSSGYIGNVTASETDYFQSIGLPPEYDALISGSLLLTGNTTITGSLTANATSQFNNNLNVMGTGSFTGGISGSTIETNTGFIKGQLVVYGPMQISNAEVGYTEKFRVDGNAYITGSLNFGSSGAHNHNVTGSFGVLGEVSSSGYAISRHLGSNAGAPIATTREGDTYWDTLAARGYMMLGGSWRQITT